MRSKKEEEKSLLENNKKLSGTRRKIYRKTNVRKMLNEMQYGWIEKEFCLHKLKALKSFYFG